MNNKSQLLILFIFLSVVSISAFSFFSNSDDEILQETSEELLKEVTAEEITTTTEAEKEFNYPDETLQDFIENVYTENILSCDSMTEVYDSDSECLKNTYDANLIILRNKDIFLDIAQDAKNYLISNKDRINKNEINNLLEISKYKTVINNLEHETLLINSLYEEKFKSSIKRTAIFASNDELLQAQVISYNFLKSGCINRGLVNSEEEWIFPQEISEKDENMMNFSLKIESSIPIGPDCMAKLIASILNDSRGWKNITEKEFLLVSEEAADFTFIFSSPDKTDELCAPLETNGIYSCRNEEEIIINYFRWRNGALDFGNDMKTYRLYLINHETGHILGWGHTGCPKEGAIAPVMMQQSKTTGGCMAYGWPLYEVIDMKYGIDTFVLLEED
jgi:hypothetical protein